MHYDDYLFRGNNKTDMSKLLCEGLRLLYENEILSSSEDNKEKLDL